MRCSVPPVLRTWRGRLGERRNPEERPVADREVDADDVLHHDPAGAEVEVADLAVSHLPLGQSNG